MTGRKNCSSFVGVAVLIVFVELFFVRDNNLLLIVLNSAFVNNIRIRHECSTLLGRNGTL
jgi:hypothetical protein